jgi:hypothetical protein
MSDISAPIKRGIESRAIDAIPLEDVPPDIQDVGLRV